MLERTILGYARARGFNQRTLERWLKLTEADQEALLGLVQGLKMGENHLRDFLDWLGEIALRDGVSLSDVLKISSDPRLGRSDKLKQIKEEVRRLRFPRLSRIEGEIQKRIREMRLKPQVQISVPPGLEGGSLTLQVRAGSYEELRELFGEIGRAFDSKAMREIFDLLAGRESNAAF